MFGLFKKMLAALHDEPAPGRASSGSPRNAPTPAAEQPEVTAPPQADQNAAEALRRIFSRRDPAQAGSLHLVGLESLRARLGGRWGTVADRVHLLTAKLLESYLGPHDTWFRHEGEVYVVVFAQLGPEQARLICAKVVEELQIMLLGEADTASIMVRTAMHEIGSEVMLVPASLKQMLDNASMHLTQGVAEASASLDRPIGIRTRRTEDAGPIEVRYRPVWDVKQQVLSVFIARSGRMRAGRCPLWGYDGLQDPEDPQQILGMDMHLIQEAVSEAAELYENRFRFFLSLPIHFESLAVLGRRRELVNVLQDIPTHMRSFMTFHLCGVPAGVPTGRLAEMVSTLRPYGRTIMAVVDPGSNDLPTLGAAGVKVACVLLPPGCSADRYRADLLRFGAIAAKNRLLTSVEGVDNMAMEALCEEAGISFLSGDLIGGWTEVPEHAVRRSLADFQR
ncbi:hypothetical protein [Niveispirillum sp. KHB5.9]|uniref:hypothetical protein n=1 Tax=Niveispirillum sp. KHB5.9 TaxID=3400269 RepID=UPI003A8A72C1